MFGDDGEEVTPVPIPNTEVKLFSADGSWGIPPVRVGRRQANERPAECWSFLGRLFRKLNMFPLFLNLFIFTIITTPYQNL